MEDVITKNEEVSYKIISTDTTDTISVDVDRENLKLAKELFDYCKYNDAELIFSKTKGSEAAAWRMLCYIMTGDIGKKGGKVATLLQESVKSRDADICETVELLKVLIDKYESAIDRRVKHRAMSSLHDAFNYTIREKMAEAIRYANKKAIDTVKEKGYIPAVYDDKAIPMRILNNKMMKYRCRMGHYRLDDIIDALKVINNDSFIQDIVNDYLIMAQCNIIGTEKFNSCIDTRDQDTLRYIKGLYTSNIAHERGTRFTRSMDRYQLMEILEELNRRGWLRIATMNNESTKYFNMINENDKIRCSKEIERLQTGSISISLEYEDITERRGYIIRGNIVNQISKEDLIIGDVTDPYTYEYIGPVKGTIYCDN